MPAIRPFSPSLLYLCTVSLCREHSIRAPPAEPPVRAREFSDFRAGLHTFGDGVLYKQLYVSNNVLKAITARFIGAVPGTVEYLEDRLRIRPPVSDGICRNLSAPLRSQREIVGFPLREAR